jgi:hypothetical protein
MITKTAKDLEKLIAATLAPYKVEAVKLEGGTDQDGDETLDVMIVLDEASIKKAGTKGFLAVTRALRAHMIERGDERFPHVRFVTPEFFADA